MSLKLIKQPRLRSVFQEQPLVMQNQPRLFINSKAQVSTEFITMIGVVMAIFFGLFLMSNYQSSSINSLGTSITAKGVCNEFSTAVNLVSSGGSGFRAYVTVPETIKGREFVMEIYNKTVVLEIDSRVVFCRLLTQNVNYTNPIPNGSLILRNENGTVIVE